MINGIKPKLTKTTELRIKPTTFDEAMDNFLSVLTENGKEKIKVYPFVSDVVFKTDGGRKYIKVKYFTKRISNEYHDDGTTTMSIVKDTRGSIHCFVDSTTGDIYKPATWRAPYTKGKNCVRGNIYDTSSFEKTDLYGGWLYAK